MDVWMLMYGWVGRECIGMRWEPFFLRFYLDLLLPVFISAGFYGCYPKPSTPHPAPSILHPKSLTLNSEP
jgi:hypothetical protein